MRVWEREGDGATAVLVLHAGGAQLHETTAKGTNRPSPRDRCLDPVDG